MGFTATVMQEFDSRGFRLPVGATPGAQASEHQRLMGTKQGNEIGACFESPGRQERRLRLVNLSHRGEVYSQLLALFVEVAAFEAHGTRYVGHMKILAANFGEQHFPFELLRALGKRTGAERSRDRILASVTGNRCVARDG